MTEIRFYHLTRKTLTAGWPKHGWLQALIYGRFFRMGTADPTLAKFRMALKDAYGDRIERVVLYGSRARGDARPDSDFDVAVFLKDMTDRWAEMDKIAAIGVDVLFETGSVVHAMPYKAGSYKDRTPLMHELRREGVDL